MGEDRFRAYARAAAAAAVLGGALVLLGWLFDIPALAEPLAGEGSMKANAALAFVVCGVTLAALTVRAHRSAVVLSTAVIVLAAATIGQDVFGWNLAIDELIAVDANRASLLPPGRMAPMTAACFLGLGLSLVASTTERTRRVAQLLAFVVILTGSVATLGYLYGVRVLYGVDGFAAMAVHSAVLFVVLGVGVFCAQPATGVMGLLASSSLAGATFRRLLPVALAVPVLIGWLRLWGQRRGFYGSEFGLSLMVVAMLVTLSGVIWWAAHSLSNMETARRRAEDAVRVRHEETAAVLDAALDAVITIDRSGRVTYWNHQAERIFGWTRAEALTRDLPELVMPERYRELHRRGMQRFLDLGEGPILGQRIEVTAIRRDGSEFPAELEVVAIRRDAEVAFTAFIADISARKHAEEALQTSDQYNAALLRLSRALELAETFDGVLSAALREVREVMGFKRVWAYVRSPDGAQASLITIQGVRAAAVAERYPSLRVTGDRLLEEIFASADPVIVEDATTDSRTDKELVGALGNRTIINVRMSLGDRHVGALGTGSFDDEGVRVPDARQTAFFASMASHVAVALDRVQLSSERQRALDDLRLLNAVLEQRVAARTAELEDANRELESFSYSVSHDLRAPLRHISGFSKMLLTHYLSQVDATAQHYLTVIHDSALNMGHMVDDLLQLARIDRQVVAPRDVDLRDLVDQVIRELQFDLAGRTIEWRVGALPVVTCDPGLMKVVFGNLLGNAVKYTRPRARATIHVEGRQIDGQDVIVVADNGVGFDDRYAHKLFGVFQRLHLAEEFEGTGIGLATVARIVRKHGGKIWAQGTVERGATFFFTIGRPVADPAVRG